MATIRNQVKVFKLQAEKGLGKRLSRDAAFLKWLPCHAAWAYNRFHVRRDTNLTPYEKTRLVKYQKPILMPGEAVLRRRPGAIVNKLEMQWLEGIWIGREAKTDEHLVGTPQGIVRARAVKRKVPSKQWDNDLVDAMK